MPKQKIPEEGAADRAAALKLFPLSPESAARFDIYAELLNKWQKTINLVSASTLPHVWTRHFADSLQVQGAVPDARIWADLGSGAGFPGLVTAIRLTEMPGAKIHLIESDSRKCAFLREVSRETQAAAIVHQGRIEDVLPTISEKIDAVSARALAPLPQLLAYSRDLLKNGATAAFLKGEKLDDELTHARALDYFDDYELSVIRSVTETSGRLLLVKQKL
ncbi:MAG TPA: 16S rRNA (guanine(527)-N(7))-methyltransferase RsmG [Methylovirgula sp.]|jgi:16S rRNA (guanine527-N7)-methyltransferase|nr:16S rRNA (guanine(527)-N(7))-methyltransferase RsmG [Methylovirgula sp.]